MGNQKSQSLSDVSKNKNVTFLFLEEKRKFPRLNFTHEQFKLNQSGKVYSILDLSINGLALHLIDSKDLVYFTLGAKLSGILNIKSQKEPIQLRVTNISKERVGCEFIDLESSLKEMLKKISDPLFLTKELKLIPGSQQFNGWYHGAFGTDFYFTVTPESEIKNFIFCFSGNFVRWTIEDGVNTGSISPLDEKTEESGVIWLETVLLRVDVNKDCNKLRIAKQLILGSNLPQGLKNLCLEHLEA
ncbi:MAG: PilZ domain-containing protein [Bdellovibrio sp.]|nr:PilZ domain-containing protein [Bdellovibrio sp.]